MRRLVVIAAVASARQVTLLVGRELQHHLVEEARDHAVTEIVLLTGDDAEYADYADAVDKFLARLCVRERDAGGRPGVSRRRRGCHVDISWRVAAPPRMPRGHFVEGRGAAADAAWIFRGGSRRGRGCRVDI